MAAVSVHARTGRNTKWPCGVCGKECRTNVIQCGCCITWYHGRCEKLRYDDIVCLGDATVDYTCRGCSMSMQSFDPELSLQRLMQNSTNFKTLEAAVDRERILIRHFPFLAGLSSRASVTMAMNMTTYRRSVHLLQSSGGTKDRTPFWKLNSPVKSVY